MKNLKQPKSSKPRKQRSFRANAPLHLRKKFLKVHISKELRKKLNTKKRTILLNKGDTVRIMVGKFKGKTGKVSNVDYNKVNITIEGLTHTNVRGQEKNTPIQPSNVEITDLNMTRYRKTVFTN
ncbi:50S ribosomal protein L24 [Candidatus Micrarchaeota archaeon]|nr:50S ribosomal protein L24 [Candidatus Micrarchaeota archaeon]